MHKISQAFVPIPEDWFSTKTAKRILRQGKTPEQGAAFHARFLYMIFRAHAIDDNGRVIGSDGLPLDCEDLADEYDRDVTGWESALLAYQALDLVEIDEDGCIRICDYRYWVRRPSDRPEATRERKRRQRERESEPLKDDVHPRDLRDVTGVTNVTNVTTRADQTRAEESRQSKDAREDEPTPHRSVSPMLIDCPFDKNSFLQDCETAHHVVTGKPFLPRSRKHTLRIAEGLNSRFGWKARSGAFLLAAQKVRHILNRGDPVDNPWGLLLTLVGDHLIEAEQYLVIAERHGSEPEFHWAHEIVEATV
mgnify:CR=1 FL=1